MVEIKPLRSFFIHLCIKYFLLWKSAQLDKADSREEKAQIAAAGLWKTCAQEKM